MYTLWEVSPANLHGVDPLWHYGDGRYRYHVPSVSCSDCGPGVGGWKRIPIECPILLAKEIEALSTTRANISPIEFLSHQQRWQQILKKNEINVRIEPGDSFLPFDWWIPTIPRYSFFWLPFETIISSRIADRFQINEITGLSLAEVVLKRVGALESTDPIPEWLFRQSNENQDFLHLAPALDSPDTLGEFFLMLVAFDSGEIWRQEVANEISTCEICGRHTIPRKLEIERNKERSHYRKKRWLPAKYIFPVNIFRSHIFDNGLVVSEEVMRLLDKNDLRNCRVRQITAIE
jgi:hypothetical protein